MEADGRLLVPVEGSDPPSSSSGTFQLLPRHHHFGWWDRKCALPVACPETFRAGGPRLGEALGRVLA
jgi:hypothetical protein